LTPGLAHSRKSTYLIHSSVAEQQQARPIEVPTALGQLIAVNAEFEMLLCVSPAGIVEHLRKIHKEKPAGSKQVQEFVAEIPWVYDYASIKLPANGSAPQPAVYRTREPN
jgi:hypothetical protein